MTPETLAQLLDMIKKSWDVLYPILYKQALFEFYFNAGYSLLIVLFTIFIVKISLELSKIKNMDYDDRKQLALKGSLALKIWNNDWEDSFLLIGWIIAIFGNIINLFTFYYALNFVVNPDYMILIKLLSVK